MVVVVAGNWRLLVITQAVGGTACHGLCPGEFCCRYRLFGSVVKASASRAADLGSNPAYALDLFLQFKSYE